MLKNSPNFSKTGDLMKNIEWPCKYNKSVDFYALGIILGSLILGKQWIPYFSYSDEEVIFNMLNY